jgi:outer membrane protein OmpA-like peptidoglycan-associated protein
MIKLALIFFSFSIISASYAQAPIRSATSEELIQKLEPSSPPILTRGMRNLTPEVRQKPNVDLSIQKPNIDLSIQFEFDSAKLLPESRPLLDNLAKAINSDKLRDFMFIVEGHTDITGRAEYNQKLSDQRAKSVLAYLTSKGVSKDRLKSLGKGSTELLTPDKPDAAENRRVRIILNS